MTDEKRTQINGFTGEEEEAAPLNLSASPADQRKLAAPPMTKPLPEAIHEYVNSGNEAGLDVDKHTGGSLISGALPGEIPLPVIHQHDTPDLNNESEVQVDVEHTDVPPANDRAREEGVPVNDEGEHYPGQDTSAHVESIEKRKEAEANGVRPENLPEVVAPVSGDEVHADKNTDEKPVGSDKFREQVKDEHNGVSTPSTSDSRATTDTPKKS